MSVRMPVLAHAGRCHRIASPAGCASNYADTLSLQPGLSYGAGRMEGRIRNGFRNGDGDKCAQYFRTGGSGDERRSREEKRLILPGGMKTQMGRRIQMTLIIDERMLMCFKVGGWIKGENMMLMVELMSENLAVKCPAECVRQHADEQCEYKGTDMAPHIHGV